MATNWIARGSLKGPKGDVGAQGVSITGATVNGSGDLIVTLSTGGQVNAGHVQGAPGGGIDFESSVATVGALPATAPYGEARYVTGDGHLYVFEADGGGVGVDGWTDVGPIRGETGATGPAGANGVSVTGAAIDGAGHLIITLSQGGPIDAGVAKGADGAAGATGPAGTDGAPGTPGTKVFAYDTTPPAVGTVRVGDLAIGANGDLLEAI
jgi:hypothetical protein